jgi:RimJ/RimL family protein N-acetyltransferase
VEQFLKVIKANPDLFRYVDFPVMDTKADFMRECYDEISASPNDCLYAIFDKVTVPEKENTRSNYAGIISLSGTNPVNAVTELGVIVFREFQRTHVATNAIGLLLQWTLDPPSAGGLGLRRVQWRTHADNAASRRAALRIGFEFEGVARWDRVFPRGGVALPVEALEGRNGTKGEVPGRHTAIFSIVWDEWDDKRPRVVALMERKG